VQLDLDIVYCPNRRCKDFGKKGLGNITIIDRYGKKRHKLLRCRSCGFRFSERRWTIFFGLHTDEGTIKQALKSLFEGNSIRKTAEEVGLDKDTVQRIWKRVVENWEKAVEQFLEGLGLEDLEFEDFISFPPANLWRAGISKRKKKGGIVYKFNKAGSF